MEKSTSCVTFVPQPSRPGYNPSTDDVGDDVIAAISVGPVFRYIIPSFSVLAVQMRQMRMKAFNLSGQEVTHDIFIRSDSSLNGAYPCNDSNYLV